MRSQIVDGKVSEGAKSDRVRNDKGISRGTGQTSRNTARQDGIIDETEVRYIRDSLGFNSFPN